MHTVHSPKSGCAQRLLQASKSRPNPGRKFSRTQISASSSTRTEKKVIRLRAQDLTPESFKPFGQVVQAFDDGKEFDEQDAQLSLDKGTPRFYIMRVPRRGRRFDRITYHADVTQVLGAVTPAPWYMAVARPSYSVEAYPREEDLVAFRVPHGVGIKMEKGTWHAGPLFEQDHMDFFNLELKDTNVVDHNTHRYSDHDTEVVIEDDDAGSRGM